MNPNLLSVPKKWWLFLRKTESKYKINLWALFLHFACLFCSWPRSTKYLTTRMKNKKWVEEMWVERLSGRFSAEHERAHFLDPEPHALLFCFLVNTLLFIKAIQRNPCKLRKKNHVWRCAHNTIDNRGVTVKNGAFQWVSRYKYLQMRCLNRKRLPGF